MRRALALFLALALFGVGGLAQEARPAPADDSARVRFESVDVYIDSGRAPLAAYQVEFIANADRVAIVGIEGGEHPAFAEPPYYDPAALTQHRVIIAAFSTAKDLPIGRTRVARLHLRVQGTEEAEYSTKLLVAATLNGELIDAKSGLD
jgi:hypothetical protein